MQRPADFHEQIADARLPQAAGVVDDAAALDAAVDVRDAHTAAGDAPRGGLLRPREGPAPWLPRRHDALHVVPCARQEAEILEPPAAHGPRVRSRIGTPLIMGAAGIGLTQTEDRECRVDQPHVFHRMGCFLAAIIARLLSRRLGALEAPCGAIVATRAEAGTGTAVAVGRSAGGDAPSVGSTMAAASTSATPRRVANSVTDRVGASPSPRSVARSTTKRA